LTPPLVCEHCGHHTTSDPGGREFGRYYSAQWIIATYSDPVLRGKKGLFVNALTIAKGKHTRKRQKKRVPIILIALDSAERACASVATVMMINSTPSEINFSSFTDTQ
jgi:hypothetical protein